jgi:cytoskeletal protein CcmA (bactofilin family)
MDTPMRRGEQVTLSIIAAGMTITGDLTTDGVVKIEGRVQGTVRAGQQVLISKGGQVQGDINTKEAVVGGEVNGAIRAEDRVEVQATAVIEGDILTRRILVMEGGRVNGEMKVGETESRAAKSAANPASTYSSAPS